MNTHSCFASFDELLSSGGFSVNSQEDFESIPDDLFDQHIAANTSFSTWGDMLDEAASQYTLKKLGL